jgi:hypothetical protein
VLKQKHLKEANCGTIDDKTIIDVKLLLVHTSNNIYRWFSCIVIVENCVFYCAKLFVHMLEYESNGLDMCGSCRILGYDKHLM